MSGTPNKENQKKYPLLPYIIAMFIVVVAIVLVSYFAQQRSSDKQISEFSQQHGDSYTVCDTVMYGKTAGADALEKQVN